MIFIWKIFIIENILQRNKRSLKGKWLFFNVWLYSGKYFEKYFTVLCERYSKRGGGEACIFGKWFTKKLGINYFLNFNKGFSGQRKLFSVWPPFYSETNTRKFENIFWKIFYSETNGALESKGFWLKKTKSTWNVSLVIT